MTEREVVPWLSGVMSAPPTPRHTTAQIVVAQDEGGMVTHVWRDGAWEAYPEPGRRWVPALMLMAALALVLAGLLLTVVL